MELSHWPGRLKFEVVAIDYFTKWTKAKALSTISVKKMTNFVYKSIICRYDIPHIIVSDNGKQFDCDEFSNFCDNLGIKKSFSAVVYSQVNGQVKAINKVLK